MTRPLVFLVPLVGVVFYWTRTREMTLLTAPEAGPHAQALVAPLLVDPGPVHHHWLRLAPGPGWRIVGGLTPWSNRQMEGSGMIGSDPWW